MIRKLKNRRGETLAEVLVAILIVSVASAMFLSAISLSGRFNLRAKEADEHFYRAMSDLEAFSADGPEVSGPLDGNLAVTVRLGSGNEFEEQFSVRVCTGESMTVYFRSSGGGSGS